MAKIQNMDKKEISNSAIEFLDDSQSYLVPKEKMDALLDLIERFSPLIEKSNDVEIEGLIPRNHTYCCEYFVTGEKRTYQYRAYPIEAELLCLRRAIGGTNAQMHRGSCPEPDLDR